MPWLANATSHPLIGVSAFLATLTTSRSIFILSCRSACLRACRPVRESNRGMVSGALETLTAGGSVVAPAGQVSDGRVDSDAAGAGLPAGTGPDRRTGAERPSRVARAWIRYDSGQTIPVEFDQLRLDHFAGSVPWRRFRSRRGQAHLSGEYFAATTGGHVMYESRLGLARLLLADFDRDVAGIYAQPCRLAAWVCGRQRRHVPDFLLASSEGVVTVVNVKPADRVLDPVVAQALAWPGDLVRQRGWRYEV